MRWPEESTHQAMQAPNPPPSLPSELVEVAGTLVSWGKGLLLVLGTIGLLWCAGQMVVGRTERHRMAVEGAKGLPWVILGLSLAAVGIPILDTIL